MELGKITGGKRRVRVGKQERSYENARSWARSPAKHEVRMLVLDAGTGQNAISQAREFLAAVAVSGIVLTKLDGTAKGGVIFAIARQLDLPIRFVGVGEQIDDLRPFSAEQFVAALFDDA